MGGLTTGLMFGFGVLNLPLDSWLICKQLK